MLNWSISRVAAGAIQNLGESGIRAVKVEPIRLAFGVHLHVVAFAHQVEDSALGGKLCRRDRGISRNRLKVVRTSPIYIDCDRDLLALGELPARMGPSYSPRIVSGDRE